MANKMVYSKSTFSHFIDQKCYFVEKGKKIVKKVLTGSKTGSLSIFSGTLLDGGYDGTNQFPPP